MPSSIDDSDSVSSSSSSSGSSEIGSSLSASRWNYYRSERGVRPLRRNNSSSSNINSAQPGPHLLEGRCYPRCYRNQTSEGLKTTSHANTQTELERSVLRDCLSNHFLLSHLPSSKLEHLCKSFEKIIYRDHEIIYSIGDASDYLYVLYSGDVCKKTDVKELSNDYDKYTVLGELAVLTGSPYQETTQAMSDSTIVFRIDSVTLHRFLLPIPKIDADRRVFLLKQAIPDEIIDLFVESDLHKLASLLEVHRFEEGEVLIHKKERLDHLVIIAEGTALSSERSLGGREYESQTFGPDLPIISFGWQSILESVDMAHFRSTIVAQSSVVVALVLPKPEFHRILGPRDFSVSTLDHLAARRLARIELENIPVFQDSALDETQTNALLDLMHRYEYDSGTDRESSTIFRSGEKLEPAIYFVREGSVTLEMNKGSDTKIISAGDYFGEKNMLRDQNKPNRNYKIRSPMTASSNGKTVIDVLYLEEIRSVIDTTIIGLGLDNNNFSGLVTQLRDIERHALLGTGSFGQVWLASISNGGESIDFDRRTVAFKVQSKYQIIESGKAERMVAERNILASLKSPFLLRLYCSFQDESRLYMVTSLLQGGELESLIPDEGMPESSAKFYAACILEGLAYMHRRHLIHRDIKTANVLLNERGYPIIIDFGFAKYVPDKTYTFVGSPIFTAPEIIRFQGYSTSVDYWAWGVLVYRLVTGKYPFFQADGNELALYKRICRGTLELDGLMTMEFRLFITSLLYPNPVKRLGSCRNGWHEISKSTWFCDPTVDLHKLRRQQISAPWTPNLKDELDASSFHPDKSEIEDLMLQSFPLIEDEQQKVFAPFGPQVE